MRVTTFIAVSVVSFLIGSAALAGGAGTEHPKQVPWAFDGVFGKVDQPSVQRGLQVYREVCAACHGLKRVAFRTLTQVGFSEAEVKALAAQYQFKDGPNDDGDMFDRPGRPSDKFPSPHANEKAARAANGGAYPPDLSLIIKARPDGANYVYSLLTGYQPAPADVHLGPTQHYNPYFPGGAIAMPEPLKADAVQYQDGTKATVDQMARDLVNFLQWAAEPEMQDRKAIGLKVMIYLSIFTLLFYIAKKRVWRNIEH